MCATTGHHFCKQAPFINKILHIVHCIFIVSSWTNGKIKVVTSPSQLIHFLADTHNPFWLHQSSSSVDHGQVHELWQGDPFTGWFPLSHHRPALLLAPSTTLLIPRKWEDTFENQQWRKVKSTTWQKQTKNTIDPPSYLSAEFWFLTSAVESSQYLSCGLFGFI